VFGGKSTNKRSTIAKAPGVGFEPTRPKGPTACLVRFLAISRFNAQRTEAHRLCRRTWLGNPGYRTGCFPRINVVLWNLSLKLQPTARCDAFNDPVCSPSKPPARMYWFMWDFLTLK